jgi:hypothetical protein
MPTLTADDISKIEAAAATIAPNHRAQFRAEAVAALAAVPVMGPGVLHRIIADAQSRHYVPPTIVPGRTAPRSRSWSR